MIDELIARIREAPDDDAPRLVLADVLIERGDPWGELIVISCKLRTTEDRAEIERLAREVSDRRKALWPSDQLNNTFSRGFFSRVSIDSANVRDVRGPAFALLRSLAVERLTDAGLAALVESSPTTEELRLVRDYDKNQPPLSTELVVRAIELSGCRALRTRNLALRRETLDAILATPVGQNVRSLDISDSPLELNFDGVAWPALDSLHLGTSMTSEQIAVLLGAGRLHGLQKLDLSLNRFGDEGMRTLAATPFTRLTDLNLRHTSITDAGIEILANAPSMQGLTSLVIERIRDGDDQLARLADFTALTNLEISGETTPSVLAQLYANLRAPLKRIVVEVTGVEGAACVPPLTRMRELDTLVLSYVPIGDAGAEVIANAELPNLYALSIDDCQIGPAGAWALARSRTLPRDVWLSFSGNDVGDAAEALRARYPDVWLGEP